MSSKGWVGVDLDGTLAHYDTWKGAEIIGEPIKPMVDRVKQWLAEGKTVKIFTARVYCPPEPQNPAMYNNSSVPLSQDQFSQMESAYKEDDYLLDKFGK